MNLLTAENAIIARLEDQIKATSTTDFDAPVVQAFPQDPTVHFENTHPNGEILVRFDGFIPDLPEPNRESVIVQNIPINWAIWIVMPNLIEHDGIYNWINKVKNALTGWYYTATTLKDWGPFYCTNCQFVEEKGGLWVYEMAFQQVLEESEA